MPWWRSEFHDNLDKELSDAAFRREIEQALPSGVRKETRAALSKVLAGKAGWDTLNGKLSPSIIAQIRTIAEGK